jgi:hypothetical protein
MKPYRKPTEREIALFGFLEDWTNEMQLKKDATTVTNIQQRTGDKDILNDIATQRTVFTNEFKSYVKSNFGRGSIVAPTIKKKLK